ncbi:WD40-repeat-containing domain protein [Russula dissimulans]|nr:WD40-repeat-containing domain protein [Russula dissimulans]
MNIRTLALQHTLLIPAHVSALTYTQNGMLILGSDDGSLRLYCPPDTKVVRAIRGLGSEVSSVASVTPTPGNFGHIWVACGRSLKLFNLDAQNLVQSNEHALTVIQVGENEADICISENRKTLAFSMDSGAVGVVDLATNNVGIMKTRHNSICAVARFIPGRPSELVSGGYDSTLIHFDFRQGTILSRRECSTTSPPQSSDISLSPPFVLCLAISSTGAIAAGTADGCLWVGLGGDKRVSLKKTRKWGGLREDTSLSRKIADGPIVALAFLDPSVVVTSTLLGVISRHTLSIEGNSEDWRIESIAIGQTQSIAKVNGLVVHDDNIVVGGLRADGKGAAEVYQHNSV